MARGGKVSASAKTGHSRALILDGLAAMILLSLLFFVGMGNQPRQSEPPARPTASAAAPPQAADPAPASSFSPGQKPLEQMISRPVGKDDPNAASSAEKWGKEKKFTIRFAVCELKESCEEVQSRLKTRGISTRVVRASQSITVHHAAMGPWPTASHANEASVKLAEKGLAGSLLVSQEKFFLVLNPRFFLKAAQEDLDAARELGYEGKIFSRHETQEMYKTYGESFKDSQSAARRLDFYKKKGVDCLLEEG